ncbi:MAG: hypothetical protein Q8K04_12270 [Lutibacter sp.]|nr:hypothetical protein [Lutibacter sp.]MDP3946888.1 hypothetical protein [Lutibacter sp.]
MKKYVTLLWLFFGLTFAYSQEPTKEKEINDLIDELFMEDDIINELAASLKNYQFLYISTTYNSDTYFSGRDIDIDQYNLTPQITYVHSNGIFAGLSGIYYSEFVPKWDVTTATVGFGRNIGKDKLFKYSVSYSRYFYANDIDNIFTNTFNVGLGVRNKKRTLGTQLSGSYLFGEEQSFEIASRSFVDVNLLKTKNTSLKFKPQLNIIAGKQTIELARIVSQNGQLVTQYTENDVFDLINTQINLPLIYSTKSFDFEAGYNLNFPNAIGDESNLKNTGFFNLSIGYLIDL